MLNDNSTYIYDNINNNVANKRIKNRKIIRILLLLTLTIILIYLAYNFFSSKKVQSNVSGVRFSANSFGLMVNDSKQIIYSVMPEISSDNISWSSSNDSIISVDKNTGIIKALDEGVVTITVKDNSDNILGMCEVYGTKNNINISSFSLIDEISIMNGYGYLLNISSQPVYATNDDFIFYSSDDKVATVDGNGYIKANGVGSAYIYVKSKYINVIKSVLVHVNQNSKYVSDKNIDSVIDIEKMVVKNNNITLKKNEVYQIETEIYPSNASNLNLNYISYNERVATVLSNGVIMAVGEGETYIEVSTNNNLTSLIKVIVSKNAVNTNSITKIDTDIDNLYLKVGTTSMIKTTISPNTVNDKSLSYTSSDNSIATISNTGIVKGNKTGRCYVTITSNNGIKKRVNIVVKNNTSDVYDIGLSSENVDLKVNKTSFIKTILSPLSAIGEKLIWKSSDSSVVVVNDGLIKGLKSGTAIITVSSKDVSKQIKVNVSENELKNIIFNKSSTTINVGDSEKILYTIDPLNIDSIVNWSSKNNNIATVNKDGIVTGIKEGTTSITCKIGNITQSMVVNITNKSKPITSIKINGLNNINVGETVKLNTTIMPTDATNQQIIWTSSNPSIASVDECGIVYGKKAGDVVITASMLGKKDTLVLKINEILVNKISLKENDITIAPEEIYLNEKAINPTNATNKNLIWSTNNENVAVVNSDGMILGVSSGTALITVKTDNGIKETLNVKVTVDSKLKLNKETLNMYVGTKEEISVIDNISDSITWTSSNDKVATVSNGIVEAINHGSATIIAKLASGKQASVIVNVSINTTITKVILNKESLFLKVNNSEKVIATIEPNGISDFLSWTSSNNSVATVSDGLIKAINPGVATITVKTSNGKTANLSVNVATNPKEITKYLYQDKTDTLSVTIVKTDKHFLTYIWAVNPNKQMKKYAASSSAISGIEPSKLLSSAIKDNNLSNKLIVASNATTIGLKNGAYSPNFYKCSYSGEYAWYGSGVVNAIDEPVSFQMYNGNVRKFFPGGKYCRKTNYTYYISRNNELKYIYPATSTYGYDSEEKIANLYKSVINDGAYNTYSFNPVLIANGKKMTKEINDSSSAGESAARQAFCQLDSNNYILVSSNEQGSTRCYSSSACKTWKLTDLADYMLSLGCINAVNFDGGGSTTLMYKAKNQASAVSVTHNGVVSRQRSNASIMYFTELD